MPSNSPVAHRSDGWVWWTRGFASAASASVDVDAEGRRRGRGRRGARAMSCNGCRVLRKGCGEACVLRPSLQWIESPEAQGHATLFVAKFFGRAGLMSFLSAVPASGRSALFQSLLFEACGRTVNPVNGVVGLLWTGNWHLCQAAVETVLRGGTLRPLTLDEEPQSAVAPLAVGCVYKFPAQGILPKPQNQLPAPPPPKRFRPMETSELDLCQPTSAVASEAHPRRRPGTPSEESVTTNADSGTRTEAAACRQHQEEQLQPRLLNLFV